MYEFDAAFDYQVASLLGASDIAGKEFGDHLCHGGFGQGEVVVGGREAGVTFAV